MYFEVFGQGDYVGRKVENAPVMLESGEAVAWPIRRNEPDIVRCAARMPQLAFEARRWVAMEIDDGFRRDGAAIDCVGELAPVFQLEALVFLLHRGRRTVEACRAHLDIILEPNAGLTGNGGVLRATLPCAGLPADAW